MQGQAGRLLCEAMMVHLEGTSEAGDTLLYLRYSIETGTGVTRVSSRLSLFPGSTELCCTYPGQTDSTAHSGEGISSNVSRSRVAWIYCDRLRDLSIFPFSSPTNPSLTLSAIATWLADHLCGQF